MNRFPLPALTPSRRRRGRAIVGALAFGRLLITASASAAALLAALRATAEPQRPVDVVLREAPPPRRVLTIEYNPLSLVIGKVSGNVVVVPIDHHGLVLTPFHVSTTTVRINRVLDMAGAVVERLPEQKFEGFGGEIGYRYYSGLGGPRGFFAGPSFALASITATAANGTETSFLDYVLGADIGYEALVGDRIAVTLGVGAQYTFTSKTIPNQQPPANIYANSGFEPRLLAALGCAF
jgi:hypothetical protein